MTMFGFERNWAQAVLEGFAPPSSKGLAPEPGEVDYLEAMTEMVHGGTRLSALGFRAALWIAVFAPLLLFGMGRRMHRLPLERRAEALDRLLRHRVFLVRELTLLLKLCACMALFRVPAMRVRSSYDPSDEDAYADVLESGARGKVRLDVVDSGPSEAGEEVA